MSTPNGPLLLVNTNRATTPSAVLPIGCLRVAEACEAADVPVEFVDLAFVGSPVRSLLRAVAQTNPAMIGISVRNIDNCDARRPVSHIAAVRGLVDAVREVTKVPIVVGGAGPSLAPAEARELLAVDCVVAGPGEEALPRLWRLVQDGGELPEVLMATDRPTVAPAADYARWLDLRPYRRRNAPLSFQSRVGCPYDCVYCNYSSIEGSRYHLGDIDLVVNAITEQVERTGIRAVEFVDSTFNSPPKYAKQLCERIASADLGLSLGASGITPRHSGRDLLEAMRDAGFEAIWCSPDAASPTTIKSYGKGFSQAQLVQMARDTSELGLKVMWAFMFGGPGETEQTVAETLAFIEEEIDPFHAVMFASRMRIYPGTELAAQAAREGYPPTILDPHAPGQFYMSPDLDPEALDAQLQGISRRCSNVMYMDASQGMAVPIAQRVYALLGRDRPVWADLPWALKGLRMLGLR